MKNESDIREELERASFKLSAIEKEERVFRAELKSVDEEREDGRLLFWEGRWKEQHG